MSSSPDEVATLAVYDIATAIGVKVDPVMVAKLVGFVIGVISGDKWQEAAQAGLARAAAIVDADAAEAAAVERNKPESP